jgi:hypothetical protein
MQPSGLQRVLGATLFVALAACQKAEPIAAPVAGPVVVTTSAAATPPTPATPPAAAMAVSAGPAVAQAADTRKPTPQSTAPVPSACTAAMDVLATCAFETTCNADMTLYLPSAARSQLVALAKKPWFSKSAFARYCESACQTKSADVNADRFAADVCAASVLSSSASRSTAGSTSAELSALAGIRIVLGEGLVVQDEPVPLKTVLERLGRPIKKSKSSFGCDSAFESEQTLEVTFADAGFEVSGQEAVLRWARLGSTAKIVLPGAEEQVATASKAVLTAIQGHAHFLPKPDTVRVAIRAGADLSRAFDFKLVAGRAARVELWIGC